MKKAPNKTQKLLHLYYFIITELKHSPFHRFHFFPCQFLSGTETFAVSVHVSWSCMNSTFKINDLFWSLAVNLIELEFKLKQIPQLKVTVKQSSTSKKTACVDFSDKYFQSINFYWITSNGLFIDPESISFETRCDVAFLFVPLCYDCAHHICSVFWLILSSGINSHAALQPTQPPGQRFWSTWCWDIVPRFMAIL